MYHLSYLDINYGIPSISWILSTPAGIGLKKEREWIRGYEVVMTTYWRFRGVEGRVCSKCPILQQRSVPIQVYPFVSLGICPARYNSITNYSVQQYFSQYQTGYNSISILRYLSYKIQLRSLVYHETYNYLNTKNKA